MVQPLITVGVKALNEERHIAAALESAVAAVAPLGGDVVLADSGSSDATIAIAERYPVRIVQLANFDERCCGAGAQLAYQYARGSYFCIIDGDMVLRDDFLPQAIAYLEEHPDVAGVGGRVREAFIENAEFAIRAKEAEKDSFWQPGEVDRLDQGGVYRVTAIQDVGYFSDRNLHAFEEFELGARLTTAKWKLVRLDLPAIDHFGHTQGGYALLWRRIRSGYSGGAGEVLRAALGRPHLPTVLARLSAIRNAVMVCLWWVLLIGGAIAGAPLALLAAIFLLPFGFLAYRRGGLRLGLYSFCQWHGVTWGLLSGVLRRRVPPETPLAAHVLKTQE